MINPEVVLFFENVGEQKEYFLQFEYEFSYGAYKNGGHKIVSMPESDGDPLIIHLYYTEDETGDDTVIHDISIGPLPNGITTWEVQAIAYETIDTLTTDQDEEEAIEKPIGQLR